MAARDRSCCIAIVEHDDLTRETMMALLANQPGFTVVACGADVQSMTACGAAPDIILMDGHFNARTWMSSPAFAESPTRARIIATGVSSSDCDLLDLMRIGVSGIVIDDMLFAELVPTIRAVAAGTQVLPTRLVATLVRNLTQTRSGLAGQEERATNG